MKCICASCLHTQPTMDRCERCGSVRVVLVRIYDEITASGKLGELYAKFDEAGPPRPELADEWPDRDPGAPEPEHAIAGISGGATSGRMAHLLAKSVVLAFQNTGLEARKTYEFLDKLEQDLGREIVWLEFRAPPRGDPPRMRTFEVVNFKTASRKGEPFIDLLECLKSYRRKHKDKGPVAPWANMRICTAYLKVRTQRSYCESLGWGSPSEYTEYVGFRVDEPLRVAKMNKRNNDRDTDERAPLFDAGITRDDVLSWWAAKGYRLEVPEHLGNCVCCFLKDERDLADAMADPEVDPQFWIEIERIYGPMRRGGRPSYAQVHAEMPERLKIRAALAAGVDVATVPIDLAPKRVRLVVAQERAPRTSFACECDAAKDTDENDLEDVA